MSSRVRDVGQKPLLPEPERAFNSRVLRWWAGVPAYEQAIILEIYAGDVLRAFGLAQQFHRYCQRTRRVTGSPPRTARAARWRRS